MSDYIRREAAIAMYEDDEIDMGALKVPVPVIVQNLKDVHAADVRPVVRGKWERRMNIGLIIWCSECGWAKHMGDERNYNYCPNCGASMEVEHD